MTKKLSDHVNHGKGRSDSKNCDPRPVPEQRDKAIRESKSLKYIHCDQYRLWHKLVFKTGQPSRCWFSRWLLFFHDPDKGYQTDKKNKNKRRPDKKMPSSDSRRSAHLHVQGSVPIDQEPVTQDLCHNACKVQSKLQLSAAVLLGFQISGLEIKGKRALLEDLAGGSFSKLTNASGGSVNPKTTNYK